MRRVLRFNRTERWAHWVNALGFLACLATGGLLAFRHDLMLDRVTIARLVNIHLVGAGVFVIGTLLVWLVGDTRSMVRWVRDGLHWGWADVVWMAYPLFKMFYWPLKIPAMGRFNSGQKVNLVVMMILKWVFLITGLMMWLGQGSLLAFYIHLGSCVAALPLLCVHLFMAVLNPRTNHSLRGMITGWVRADWAHEHHRRWLESPRVTVVDSEDSVPTGPEIVVEVGQSEGAKEDARWLAL